MSDNPDLIPAHTAVVPRAIEVGFPIVEINRLAEPERNSFKPIYQMHKWFARRASCVFRAILLGALKPAFKPDGTPVDLMEEFYRDHSEDPDTAGKLVLDPFMGGGTTVVEALRLGCKVTGIDLNPVAWFVVKTEVEPIDLGELRAAFERLAARPVAWNGGRPLRETLLDLYRTEVAPGLEADVIYTFWVKYAVCTAQDCRREVPLFKDWLVAHKTVSIPYFRDVKCPKCGKAFDWEIDLASLVAEPAVMVRSPRGSGGEGRPASPWVYLPLPPKPRRRRESTIVKLRCPCCAEDVEMEVPWAKKKERKKVQLTVLLCPSCDAVWQWRGPLPEGSVKCPCCAHEYDPRRGNVPEKGWFQCSCGNRDRIIESIRRLPQEKRLPVRPYAIQAYLPPDALNVEEDAAADGVQHSLFGDGLDRQQVLALKRAKPGQDAASGLLLPPNGKFFKRFSVRDQARLQQAEALWERYKSVLPYPKSKIPVGEKTKSGLLAHHYNYWHEMFAPRQLLALSTLLQAIMAEEDQKLQEALLCSFSAILELNNFFTRYMVARSSAGGQTAQGVFARHDFQPKITIAENNVFGLPNIGMGSFESKCELLLDGLKYQRKCWDFRDDGNEKKRRKVSTDRVTDAERKLLCANSAESLVISADAVITDPPYVGNVNYSELANFFYVWLRLALKDRYRFFAPEYTPAAEEIVENRTRGKSREDFYAGLSKVFEGIHEQLRDDGLLVFTFHHTDQEGSVWEGLLQSLCDTGFEIIAVYPVHGEAETSLHLINKENVAYDLIHVCRKRRENPTDRSWAGIRQEVRRRARAELKEIEAGRYGNKPLAEADVRLICIGKCLELYSAHYNRVLDHEGKPLPLQQALRDIATIVDQLVTRERPLPAELEGVDSLSYAWLRLLMPVRTEISVDRISKGLRAMQVSLEDFKKAGLIVRGRVGRGRTYEVKQPRERLQAAMEQLNKASRSELQGQLFDGDNAAANRDFFLVDLIHALIALADAGESVLPLLQQFRPRWLQIAAGLKFVRDVRSDWEPAISRVLAVMEGAPLLREAGVA
jgi:putative DNA methylase